MSTKAWILELWDSGVPVISGTGADIICSFSPNAGQRDQYQSQGATQAPSATQIGQRGQGMGRGRGQDFQARTSGTRGRFYAVVQQTKLADQYDMWGTFMLSQECRLNSDASYSCLLLHNVRKVWA